MTPAIKKMDSFYFRTFPFFLMVIFISIFTIRLSLMQLDGLLTFGASFVTALFAMTALMYARARAVAELGEMERRAEIADESLKAAFIAVMGFGVSSFIFFTLSDYYQAKCDMPRRLQDYRPDLVPMICSFLCTAIFALPTLVKVNLVVEMTAENMGLRIKKNAPQPRSDIKDDAH